MNLPSPGSDSEAKGSNSVNGEGYQNGNEKSYLLLIDVARDCQMANHS